MHSLRPNASPNVRRRRRERNQRRIQHTVPVLSTSCLSVVLVSSRLERSPRESSTRRLCTRKRTFSNNCPPLRSDDRGLGAGRKRSFGTSRTARRTRRWTCGRFCRQDDGITMLSLFTSSNSIKAKLRRRRLDDDRRHFRVETTKTPSSPRGWQTFLRRPLPSRIKPLLTKESSAPLFCQEERRGDFLIICPKKGKKI